MSLTIGSNWLIPGGWTTTGYSINQLYVWGNNSQGQLGANTSLSTQFSTPTQIGTSQLWTSIADGYQYSVAIQSPGTLWAWGLGANGQLGQGNTSSTSSPVQVTTGVVPVVQNLWKTVSVQNGSMVLAIQSNGTLYGWGINNLYQLALPLQTNYSYPTQISSLNAWSQAYTGSNSGLALQSNGTLWTWGSNSFGQLGINTSNNIIISTPVQIGTSSNWVTANCGQSHTLMIQSNGTLWACGYNGLGQLGLSDNVNRSSLVQVGNLSNWAKVSCGSNHSMALQSNGTLWTVGYNYYGQLGQGISTSTNLSTFTQVGALSTWVQITAGPAESWAIQSNGTMWACGYGNQGNLGVNSVVFDTITFVQVGSGSNWAQVSGANQSAGAIQSNGTLWAWGNNSYGQLGTGVVGAQVLTPVQVGSLSNWTSVSQSGFNTFALNTIGGLYAYGSGSYLQGTNSTANMSTPVQINSFVNSAWAKVATGGQTTLGLSSLGTLFAFGANGFGQLGTNDTNGRLIPTQIGILSTWSNIACGYNSSYAIQTPGSLYAFGNNSYGQLGLGDITHRSSPVQVGALSGWTQSSAGSSHALGLQNNSSLWAWGNNSYGQLGLNTLTNYSSPVQVGALTIWQQIASGTQHNICLQNNGTIWSWGNNSYGQLGLSDQTHRSSPTQIGNLSNWAFVAAGQFHTLAIQSPGTLWTWGNNSFGQLGVNVTTFFSSPVQVGILSTWTQVSGGLNHSNGIYYQ